MLPSLVSRMQSGRPADGSAFGIFAFSQRWSDIIFSMMIFYNLINYDPTTFCPLSILWSTWHYDQNGQFCQVRCGKNILFVTLLSWTLSSPVSNTLKYYQSNGCVQCKFCCSAELNKTIGDEGITVDFSIIKVHTSNWSSNSWGSSNTWGSSESSCWDHQIVGDHRIPLDL